MFKQINNTLFYNILTPLFYITQSLKLLVLPCTKKYTDYIYWLRLTKLLSKHNTIGFNSSVFDVFTTILSVRLSMLSCIKAFALHRSAIENRSYFVIRKVQICYRVPAKLAIKC